MSITYGRERFMDVWPEAKPLAKRDWEETSFYRHLCEFGINEAIYQDFEDSGRLRVYVARRDDKLIGYCVFIATPGTHHAPTVPHAIGADLWLAPEERKGMAGVKLITMAEAALDLEGMVVLSMNVPPGSTADLLLERMGYQAREVARTKVFDRRRGHA